MFKVQGKQMYRINIITPAQYLGQIMLLHTCPDYMRRLFVALYIAVNPAIHAQIYMLPK